MTSGFQQQDRSMSQCFTKTARSPQQVGQKLKTMPNDLKTERPPEPRTFR